MHNVYERFTALHCPSLPFTALHCPSLPFTALSWVYLQGRCLPELCDGTGRRLFSTWHRWTEKVKLLSDDRYAKNVDALAHGRQHVIPVLTS